MVLDVTGEEPVLHVLQGASGLRGELVIKSAGGEEVRLESAASAAEVASEVLKAISPN